MLEKLNAIIRAYKGDDSLVIRPETVIGEDLGMSSFDLIQLVCAVEDAFDVEIPDREIKNFKTVGDVLAFIEAQTEDA